MGKGAGASAASGAADTEQPRTWKDAWPFYVALVIVALAALGIWFSHVLRPAADRAGDSAKVQYAVNNIYTARNNLDYAKYRANTCATDVNSGAIASEREFLTQNRHSVQINGVIVIPQITDVTITGGRATARVHWHFEKSPHTTKVNSVVVVKDNGEWKVCKA
ncbi:MAG: hypothetical protein QM673_08780 [Gordonia sp. (in: high G+C Gram-positive bacteria)]